MLATTEPYLEWGNEVRQIETETVRNTIEPFAYCGVEDFVQYRNSKAQGKVVR